MHRTSSEYQNKQAEKLELLLFIKAETFKSEEKKTVINTMKKRDTDVFFLSYNFNLQSLFILIKRKMTVGKVYRCCGKSEGRKISKRKGKLLEL